jgi:hypothetical protein
MEFIANHNALDVLDGITPACNSQLHNVTLSLKSILYMTSILAVFFGITEYGRAQL